MIYKIDTETVLIDLGWAKIILTKNLVSHHFKTNQTTLCITKMYYSCLFHPHLTPESINRLYDVKKVFENESL